MMAQALGKPVNSSAVRPRSLQWALGLLVGTLVAKPSPAAGTVTTAGERLQGEVAVGEGRIEVRSDGAVRKVPWEEVLYLHVGDPLHHARGPQEIRLRDGEVWQGHILSLRGGTLEVRSPLFGTQGVPVAAVASLEFRPGAPSCEAAPRGPMAGWLYRERGEPTPATVLWIDRDQLAADTPLGVLTLKREGLARYVFSRQPDASSAGGGRSDAAAQGGASAGEGATGNAAEGGPPADGEEAEATDTVLLADATLLRGRLELSRARLTLHHPVLGELSFPPETLRSAARRVRGVHDLVSMSPLSVRTLPLIAGSVTDEGLRVETSAVTRRYGDPPFSRALRIEPPTTVRYALPAGKGPGVFRVLLSRAGGARGDLRVVARVGEEVLLDEELDPSWKPRWIERAVPRGEALEIEVDFGARIRFPAAVLLVEPHVIESENTEQPR